MAQKSKKVSKLTSNLNKELRFCKFSDKHEEVARAIQKGILEKKIADPYYYFGTRLCGYLFLLKEKSVDYMQILKYERDFCDDGGKCQEMYARDYGLYWHSDIIKASMPQNECFHFDGKHDEYEESALVFLLSALNKKISG